MKEPLGTRYVPGYDLFKLIVAVILTVILIILLLRESREQFARIESSPAFTANYTDVPSNTAMPVSPTPTSFGTSAVVETMITPAMTEEVPAAETPAPVTTLPSTPEQSSSEDCPSNPTRIQNGDTVRVLDWLNFRVGPGLNFPIQQTNKPGTEMDVIGGPVCTMKQENLPRAYLWWNVRMEDGIEGWSAEAPLNFPNYFLEPVR